MGRYEPSWNAEEQTMIDLMELGGYRIWASIDKDYTAIALVRPKANDKMFTADTPYEALRKCFSFWSSNNEAN
jgi:hypothetical protein